MPDAERSSRILDERIAEIARERQCKDEELREICDELLYRRRQSRKDSRRAEQVRKLRWTAEGILAKIEVLSKHDAEVEAAEKDSEHG